ncbi:MAG: ABC transporter permease [Oscillospiraceae bacterium]|nr:ABC transporter permease [Oscillospiraceae bacterium]MDD6503010.1 ABC transporter permease [Oscillospiraceae bacterium]
MSWLKYAGKRLLMLIPVIICVTFLLYLILAAAPGSLARQLLGDDATPEQIAAKEAEMGLDDPVLVRYVKYMADVCRLDFGESWVNGESVLTRFATRLPNTLLLSVLAMLFACAVGIPLGIGSAIKQYSLLDYGSSFVAMLLFSIPAFWLGTMCQILFCLTLHWLPVSGFDNWKSMILPTVILGANTLATMIRMSRTSMLDVIRQDYIRTAKAKGASMRTVISHHAMRNSMIPIVTQVGVSFAGTIGGAVVTENIFNISGIGTMLLSAVKSRDVPVVLGTVIFVTIIVGVINLVVDLICALIDPRIDLAS